MWPSPATAPPQSQAVRTACPSPLGESEGALTRTDMPPSPARPCTHIGCRALSRDGTGRCPDHPREKWGKRADAPKRITGSKLQALRAALFRESPLCVVCMAAGRVTVATERDHIIPLSQTRMDVPNNNGVQALCHACHEVKSKAERLAGR